MIPELRSAHPTLSTRQLCRLLDVNPARHYRRLARLARLAREAGEAADSDLRDRVERVVLEMPGYGYRRVTRHLAREGLVVNHKRVLRMMRAEGLLCRPKRRFVVTTDSNHGLRCHPNLIKDLEIDALDRVWIADLTYIRLGSGFVYLACVLDAYSRRCVGWALSRFIDTRLALAALEMALSARNPAAGLIHHSDRGSQYAANAYLKRLEAAGARSSMSARGNPYENARMESFVGTVKREEVELKDYQSLHAVQENIARFLEEVYNCKRLHSSLGYLPPVEFEESVKNREPRQ